MAHDSLKVPVLSMSMNQFFVDFHTLAITPQSLGKRGDYVSIEGIFMENFSSISANLLMRCVEVARLLE